MLPRRAGLIVAEPYGSVADWPLVSMLAADRGRRTLVWWVTRPSDDYLLVRERRLRDAAFALGGVEAMIAGPQVSSRVDGPAAFDWPHAMPEAAFDGSAAAEKLEIRISPNAGAADSAQANTTNPRMFVTPCGRPSVSCDASILGGGFHLLCIGSSVARQSVRTPNE